MAISVPIGTEHYIFLKEISDKLGLSLKKTLEHIVAIHYSEVIKESVKEMREERGDFPPKRVHDIEMTAPSLRYESNPSMVQVHAQRNVITNPKDETTNPAKITVPPSKPVSNSQPWVKYANTSVENHKTIPNPETFTVPIYSPTAQTCISCGASKSSDAKFCHSCGHSL